MGNAPSESSRADHGQDIGDAQTEAFRLIIHRLLGPSSQVRVLGKRQQIQSVMTRTAGEVTERTRRRN